MFDGQTTFRYDGRPIADILAEQAPTPPQFGAHNDFTVYVMGPYTAFDATYAYDDADKLRTPFQADPLFDPDEHVTDDGTGDMEQALRDFCAELREHHNCRAFIATDIDIPTHQQAAARNRAREPGTSRVEGMDPLAQSVAFAAHSDAVIFLFTAGGLTTGVGTETGGILGEFHLRRGNSALTHKPGQRISVYRHAAFTSATVTELPQGYDVRYDTFEEKAGLHDKVRNWLDSLSREARDTNLPVFVTGDTYAPDS
ncbi:MULTISPECIES: hypothetical protein [unclassified Haladaptatus]|uniref:DUF7509 family protein n=1 Tax=unclassified Haladaptatus TaxID=2622732 RepID=UPI0023E8C6D4|nr:MULTISPECIES: hypothetical protein [unclassified Haladaptatus]